ncbi:5'-methylthioadenosine/S-adenosylhomocysteine nucleosidase [Mycoplasmoides pirum]|uniref:5'-methylthioadenosine/S-adenosylhomocysteine nucleosidase n=1 Tax=Mycoplasmoides pirum TaxID=2122 RepID=UPI0004831462|nr:5'-methylthioadenosine/S-adenosylhomocysteine nucleosidase [Mycoplasmoides pirum]
MIEKQIYNFGFIFALEEEAKSLIDFLSKFSRSKIILNEVKRKLFYFELSKEINLLNHKTNKIYIFISSVGKTNASIASTHLIVKYKIDILINIGVVGVIDKSIKLLSPILINYSKYYDVDLTIFNYENNQLPNTPSSFQTNMFLLENIKNVLLKNKIKFYEANIASGDKFITKKNIKFLNLVKSGIKVIDMELASIMHTAFLYKIPIISVKFGSDYVLSPNNDAEYKKIIKKYSKEFRKFIKLLFLN